MVCFVFWGIFIGTICSLLYVNFDNSFKKIILSLVNIGGSSGILFYYHTYYEISSQFDKLVTSTSFIIAFIVSFCISMYAICWLIKDKDDADIIRIRDILLGQKDYIQKYYEWRKKQIDEKLQIPLLEEREKKVSEREDACERIERLQAESREAIEKAGKKRLYLPLPDNKKVYLKQEFINELPSFMECFSNCINGIESYFADEIKKIRDNKDTETQDSFKAFLMNIELNILTSFFGNSSQIRIHFRFYNKVTKNYEMLVAVTGKRGEPELVNKMTPIPYKDSMIEKSFNCKRAVIKSLNAKSTRYDGNNHTVWRDYMTYAFYGIKVKTSDNIDIPILTFGISVKNEDRYKDIFRFMNFAKIEDYLNSNIERLHEVVPINTIIYCE